VLELIKVINLALRFLLELCALVALGYWGFKTGSRAITKIGLGIGAPLLVAVVWGTFLSPQALVQLPELLVLILQVLVFGSAAAALVATGHRRDQRDPDVRMGTMTRGRLRGEEFAEVRSRLVLGQHAQDLFCVVDDQGYVALTGVEARLTVWDDLG
jgi:hypothetical protein